MKHASHHSSSAVNSRYPTIVRIYGLLGIFAGVFQVGMIAISIWLIVSGRTGLHLLQEGQTVTFIIQVLAIVLSVVLSVLFVVLGVRIFRNNRHAVIRLTNIMIALEVMVLILHVMLTGIGPSLILPGINTVILIALQTYSDPSLGDERRLQHHLHALEDKQQLEEGTLGRDTTGKGYITLNFYNVFWVFVVCSILGLGIEILWHMIVVDPGQYQDRAGLLYGPFSPIYGFGAVLMTVALNRFHKSNPLVIFLVSAVIGGAFEFFVSWFLEMAFGITAWDYTGTFLSIGGRTNGMFMFIWGMLGLVWIKLGLPVILRLVNKIPWNWRYIVTGLFAILMAFDGVMTLSALDCWFQREDGSMDYTHPSAIVEFCNENYDNDFMEQRFQSMSIDPDSASRV